ncbi:hypothetical protein [Alteromonas sp. 5E99-2]|nr:hypothetical protein [Alteromonas sp. 5E99-2]
MALPSVVSVVFATLLFGGVNSLVTFLVTFAIILLSFIPKESD